MLRFAGLGSRACSSRMGLGAKVSQPLASQPVGSAQQASTGASEHSEEVAERVIQEGLPHVPKHLKVGGRRAAARRRRGGRRLAAL